MQRAARLCAILVFPACSSGGQGGGLGDAGSVHDAAPTEQIVAGDGGGVLLNAPMVDAAAGSDVCSGPACDRRIEWKVVISTPVRTGTSGWFGFRGWAVGRAGVYAFVENFGGPFTVGESPSAAPPTYGWGSGSIAKFQTTGVFAWLAPVASAMWWSPHPWLLPDGSVRFHYWDTTRTVDSDGKNVGSVPSCCAECCTGWAGVDRFEPVSHTAFDEAGGRLVAGSGRVRDRRIGYAALQTNDGRLIWFTRLEGEVFGTASPVSSAATRIAFGADGSVWVAGSVVGLVPEPTGQVFVARLGAGGKPRPIPGVTSPAVLKPSPRRRGERSSPRDS